MTDNYPDDIRDFDWRPMSPFYVEPEEAEEEAMQEIIDMLEEIACRMAQEIQEFIDESGTPQPGAEALLKEFDELCKTI